MDAPLNVLFVDDEPMLISLYQDIAEYAPINPHFAESTEEALQKLTETTFSIVISDFHLPGASGLDLLSHLKRHSPQTVRILVSGHSDDASLQLSECEEVVDKYLTKPFTINEILTMIEKAIQLSKK